MPESRLQGFHRSKPRLNEAERVQKWRKYGSRHVQAQGRTQENNGGQSEQHRNGAGNLRGLRPWRCSVNPRQARRRRRVGDNGTGVRRALASSTPRQGEHCGVLRVHGTTEDHPFRTTHDLRWWRQVFVLITFEATSRGKSYSFPNNSHLWQFNAAGKVVKYDHVTDTAQMIRMAKGE
jgi:hypothetical protein